MKKHLKKLSCVILAYILCLNSFNILTYASEENVIDLIQNKIYKYDLDKDGKKESIYYNFNNNYFNIYINDELSISKKFDDEFYEGCLQIVDIDESDNRLDLWAYAFASSDDISYSELFEFNGKTMESIFNLEPKKIIKGFYQTYGFLYSTDGKGTFYVSMDRPISKISMIGNYNLLVPYKLKDSKVTMKKVNKYYFSQLYTIPLNNNNNFNNKKGKFIANKKIICYSKHNAKSDVAFIVNKGDKVYIKSIYISNSGKIYLKCKKSGKIGWLLSNNDYEMFSNALFAD